MTGNSKGGALTPTTRRLVDVGTAIRGGPPADLDFLHSVLCQTGLPYRDPGADLRVWERRQGDVLLRVEAGAVADPRGRDFIEVGLPHGEKARLVLIHLTGEALRTGSPVIPVQDSLTAYVGALGLPTDGRTIRTVKDQLARLSAATVRLAVLSGDRAVQVNSTLVRGLDLWAPRDPRQRVLWPSAVELSADFFRSVQAHAVPLDRRAVGALSHSAMALDAYCWLAQRLHRIPSGRPQLVPWETLKVQFGPSFARLRKFRETFRDALREVQQVYPVARVEDGEEGLTLRHSPPPVARRLISGCSLPKPD
jgi:hypothetical protein